MTEISLTQDDLIAQIEMLQKTIEELESDKAD